MVRSVVLLSLALGCSPRLDETFEEDLRRLTGVLHAGDDGVVRTRVKVEPTETAMLVTGVTGRPLRTHIRSLDAPGASVFDAFDQTDPTHTKTNGGYVATVASLNWPVSATDPGLEEGRWDVRLGLVDPSDEWTSGEIAVDVLLKEDDDFDAGRVHASIVYTDGLDEDPALVAATEEAIAHWAELYADRGIILEWDVHSFGGGAEMEPPGLGSPEAWEEISSMTRLRTINVVIAPTIVGFDDIYGIAGDIPGPLVSSSRSGVLIASLLAAGPDGRFSNEELRLYGETLAHEAGHYLGLFHPVEVEFDRWDALEDTPECGTDETCIDLMGRNLMFPFPVCGFTSCTPQDQLTDDQSGVIHRHVAVE